MTNAERIELRNLTYKGPTIPEKRCENCRYGRFTMSNTCQLPLGRGGIEFIETHRYGTCDAHEPKKG